jgi:hypothetical protein
VSEPKVFDQCHQQEVTFLITGVIASLAIAGIAIDAARSFE